MFGKFKHIFKAILKGFNVISIIGSVLTFKRNKNTVKSKEKQHEPERMQPTKVAQKPNFKKFKKHKGKK